MAVWRELQRFLRRKRLRTLVGPWGLEPQTSTVSIASSIKQELLTTAIPRSIHAGARDMPYCAAYPLRFLVWGCSQRGCVTNCVTLWRGKWPLPGRKNDVEIAAFAIPRHSPPCKAALAFPRYPHPLPATPTYRSLSRPEGQMFAGGESGVCETPPTRCQRIALRATGRDSEGSYRAMRRGEENFDCLILSGVVTIEL